jgi:four helix bundle protein
MARAYAGSVYAVTGRFPRHEDYGLRSQMNRAVNSISLNIAQGAAKNGDRAFDYHLEIALGSPFELIAAGFLSLDRGYITEQQCQELYDEGERLAKAINALRHTLHRQPA